MTMYGMFRIQCMVSEGVFDVANGIFGNMFDFNGDGKLDAFEQAAECDFLRRMMETDKDDDDIEEEDDGGIRISLSISLSTGDDEPEEDWRDPYYGDELGIDPDDYDTEEKYKEAVAEKEAWILAIPDNIASIAEEHFIEPEDYDSYEDFIDAVKDAL